MQRLDAAQLALFMQPLNQLQSEIVTILRDVVVMEDPQVDERIEDGKWLHGYLKYDSPQGNFIYAIGAKASGKIAFHAMTFYGSQVLQERYGPALNPFLTGKSCFDFNAPQDVPVSVLAAMVHNGAQHIDESVARHKR